MVKEPLTPKFAGSIGLPATRIAQTKRPATLLSPGANLVRGKL